MRFQAVFFRRLSGRSNRSSPPPPPQQISLETERLGPRRVEGLRREDEEWQKKAHAAVLSIQELTVKFFETTTRAQKGTKEKRISLLTLHSPLDLCAGCLLSWLSAGSAPPRNVCESPVILFFFPSGLCCAKVLLFPPLEVF